MTKLVQFLPDLVKGRVTFLEVSVIGACQKRTEMFACDFCPFGVQLIGRLSDFRSCPISPREGLNLPVVRKAVGDGATLCREAPVDACFAMICALDYLTNRWRWVLIHGCLKYMQYVGRVHSAFT